MKWKQLDKNHKISDTGKIVITKQINRYPVGTVIKGFKSNKGYIRVRLNHKVVMLHRIVGMLFVDGYSKNKEINHKNGKRDDNRACNLEWVTHLENIRYSINVLKHKIGGLKDKVKVKDSNGIIYESIKDAADKNNISYDRLRAAIRFNRKINGIYFNRI